METVHYKLFYRIFVVTKFFGSLLGEYAKSELSGVVEDWQRNMLFLIFRKLIKSCLG